MLTLPRDAISKDTEQHGGMLTNFLSHFVACGCIFVHFLNLEGHFEAILVFWEPLCVIFTFQGRFGTSKRQIGEASRTPFEVQFELFLAKMHVFFRSVF